MITESGRDERLHASIANPVDASRPIITSLNGDNSWLWSFPRPVSEREKFGKAYYHILFEPWLNGPTSFLTSWMIHLQLPDAPAIPDSKSVLALVKQIELAAAQALNTKYTPATNDTVIDAILLGFHYLDHVHEPTLRLFNNRIPVVASPEAAAIVNRWKYFDTVKTISEFTTGSTQWDLPGLHPGILPSWLLPIRLPGHHELNYVLAFIWTHLSQDGSEEIHEAILQTPHGTRVVEGSLQAFLNSSPKTEKLAILHGLKESVAGGAKNTYGAESGVALFRAVGGAKYWIETHGGALQYSGFVMWALGVKDTPRTLEWALEKEMNEQEREGVGEKPNFVQVENGGILILA